MTLVSVFPVDEGAELTARQITAFRARVLAHPRECELPLGCWTLASIYTLTEQKGTRVSCSLEVDGALRRAAR